MKGISPLIATVLLISFTMAAAAILNSWSSTFTRTQVSTVGEKSEYEILCSRGSISIAEISYSASAKKLSAVFQNDGKIALGGFMFTVVYDGSNASTGNYMLTPKTPQLLPGEPGTGWNSSVEPNIKTVRLRTNCSTVYEDKKYADITKLP